MKKFTLKTTLRNTMISLVMSSLLIGCTSTTGTGTVGVKRQQFMLLSPQQVEKMAKKSYRELLYKAKREGKLDTNYAQRQRLQRIANKLIPQAKIYRPDAVNWKWEVHTTKSDELNAFVLAGGKIMFYTGIIDRLKLTDAEIAAIMGHEMAHALREHTRERMSSSYATQMGIGILAGSLGLSKGQTQVANIAGSLGIGRPHSRLQESEADSIGLELMARAGYHPQSAITLWKKMQKTGSTGRMPQILSTHPNVSKRIGTMRSLMPKVMPLYKRSQK